MKNPEQSILGTGWSFPPTFSRADFSVDTASDEPDIQQSLRVLFSTAKGERVMVPGYGCDLWRLVFRSVNTTFKTEAAEAIRMAVLYWEPRIDVTEIKIEPSAETEGLVLITLGYVIRRTNARNNLVYPFYLGEGTLVPQV
jgi:uncharacterized protein